MNERSRTPSEDSVPACVVITSFRTERAMAGRRSSTSPFDEVFGDEPLAEKTIVRAMTRHGKFRGVAAKPKAAASQGMLRSWSTGICVLDASSGYMYRKVAAQAQLNGAGRW